MASSSRRRARNDRGAATVSTTTVAERLRTTRGVSPQASKRKVRIGAPPFGAGPGAFPDFVYHGGRVITNPKANLIFLGDWSSSANQTRATRLQQFLNDLMNSDYMNMLAQYGCGSSGTVVNSVFIASSDHDLNRNDIESIFQTAINSSTIPEPTDQSSIYCLFLDDATGVNGVFGGDTTVMCEATNDDAFGFHFHFNTTAGNELFYAVVPGLTDTCLTDSCPDDSTCSLHTSQTREQRQTQVLSHEFAEMITNPDVEGSEGWSSNSPFDPHENGDICNGQSGTITVGPNTWTVQKMYSKYDDQQTNGNTTCVLGSSFPLPSLLPACTVMLDRSMFGKDEVDAFLNGPSHVPATFDAALYVAVDGLTANQLGISASSFVGTPNVQPSFAFSPNVPGLTITATALSAPDQGQLDILQRFTWTCRVTFTSDAGFPTVPGNVTTVTATASLSTVSGSADIQLVDEPNPYEIDGTVSWLSTDLRVLQMQAGDTRFNTTLGSTPADAVSFIQNALQRLRNGTSGADTFDTISTDEDTSALELSEQVNGVPVFYFAVARVRYRSLSADAPNVRVFFRLFPVSTTSTAYDQNTTYRRGGTGGVVIPKLGLVGGQTTSIPFFATARIDSSTQSMDDQTDPTNVQTLSHDASGAEVESYFGCWLDINQPSQPQFPIAPASPVDGPYSSGRQTIQDLIRNAHQCLTAEIELDGVTLITNGQTPGSSDKLAQRNLSIVASDNPGSPASHRIPNTFEIKPSSFEVFKGAQPDELLIDWGNVPGGTEAALFLPGTDADTILRLADSRYVVHKLSKADSHTLRCPAEGITYLPIPPGAGANYAGLLTIDLPPSVKRGQSFRVVARQLTDAVGRRIVPPPPIGAGQHDGAVVFAEREPLIRWRKVTGSFQISIPVRTKEVMLEPEERLLAVLKWIGRSIPPTDRWSPVFGRYLEVVSDRVTALGGDPDKIEPSPSGDGHKRHPGPEQRLSFVGRAAEIVYDRYGEFDGFVLDTEDGPRSFFSHEDQLGDLVRDAWEDRLLIRVVVERESLVKPLSIVLLRAPRHHRHEE